VKQFPPSKLLYLLGFTSLLQYHLKCVVKTTSNGKKLTKRMKNRFKNFTRNGQGIEREKVKKSQEKIVRISFSQDSFVRQNFLVIALCNALLQMTHQVLSKTANQYTKATLKGL